MSKKPCPTCAAREWGACYHQEYGQCRWAEKQTIMKKKYELEVTAKIKISLSEVELTEEEYHSLKSVKFCDLQMHSPEFGILDNVGVDFTDPTDMDDICIDNLYPSNPEDKF